MRLRLQIPEVRPDEYEVPPTCPYGCGGHYFALHQRWSKAVADTVYTEVIVRRYKCVRCGRSFRVHPTGINADHRSQRLRGIGVMLYVLGLSYGAVADALRALGWVGSKSSIYRDVQAAGEAVGALRRRQVGQGGVRRIQVASADATYVVCRGEEVTVLLALNALSGDVLDVELVDSESAQEMRAFLQRMHEEFGFEALLTDDQDSYKVLADELGIEHGLCRTHINRNTARIVAELAEQALHTTSPPPPGVQSDPERILADLEYFQWLMALRPSDGAIQLTLLLRRYQAAPTPAKGQKASLWYRLRLALLRALNNWNRLTFDQRWNRRHASQLPHLDGTNLDGTNNVAERAIGSWIKERYRTMRTYKRRASVLNLCRLIPFLAAHPDQPLLSQLLAA